MQLHVPATDRDDVESDIREGAVTRQRVLYGAGCRAGQGTPPRVLAGDFLSQRPESLSVDSPDDTAEEESGGESEGQSGQGPDHGSGLPGMAYRKPAHAVKLTGANVLLYPHSRSESLCHHRDFAGVW